tara:strand:+ start:732 stop:1838 length:1107 start_codon:yes stop_codon:yes gene_type:complete
MKKIKLKIKNKSQNYPIIIGSNIISTFSKFLKNNKFNFSKYLLIVDKNVPKKMINKLKKSIGRKKKIIYLFDAKEKNKVYKSANVMLEIMLKNNFSRDDCLIAVGGGITGDVSSFAASLFKRGINFINIPTTLLSQVDSSIGGKTGINTANGKNLIGTFYQPKIVITDTDFLKTLPKREIICGYAEILKHSIIANRNFYLYLDKNVEKILNLRSPYIEKSIFESCKIKTKIVEEDEKEAGLRKTLNFGHTFAHAFETTLKYSKKLNHGEAVILGINSALKFSYKNNLINKKNYLQIIDHIRRSKLPNKLSKYFNHRDIKKIVSFMKNDKKNKSNKINLILLNTIGRTVIHKYFNETLLINFLKNELIK